MQSPALDHGEGRRLDQWTCRFLSPRSHVAVPAVASMHAHISPCVPGAFCSRCAYEFWTRRTESDSPTRDPAFSFLSGLVIQTLLPLCRRRQTHQVTAVTFS